MSEASLGIDASDFRKAADALSDAGLKRVANRPVSQAIRQAANAYRRNVRAELKGHRRTGKMISRVMVRTRGYGVGLVAGVRSTGSQSNLIAGGVSPHEIAGPVMPLWDGRGKGSGITGFATAVQHPGFPPDPFFARGVRQAAPEVQKIANEAADTMARALARQMEGKP